MQESAIFRSNMQFMQKHGAEVYDSLHSAKKIAGEVVFLNGNEKPLLQYKSASINMHSRYDMQREFEEMFRHVNANITTLILFGVGSLDVIKHIKENYQEIKHLIIIEPHANVLLRILNEVDVVDLFQMFGKVSMIVNKDEREGIKSLENLLLGMDNYEEHNIAVAGLFAYQIIYVEYYRNIMQSALKIIRFHRVNKSTLENFRLLWLVNLWKNMRHLSPDIGAFKSLFTGRPAIIVSAGPSLDKNIDQLKMLHDRAIIIAVGSAIKILETHGIVPHFRMAIDATKENELLFKSVDTAVSPIIFSGHLYFPILDEYYGDKINVLINSDPMARFIYQQAGIDFVNIRSGFSVANTALDLALKMGADPIVLIGQDLCYTDGKLHAKGSWDDTLGEKYVKKEIETVNVNGEKVYTDRAFLGMKKVFEAYMEEGVNARVINATDGGLKIEGMDHHPLQFVMDNFLQNKYDLQAEYKQLMKRAQSILPDNKQALDKAVGEVLEQAEKIKQMNNAIIETIYQTDALLKKKNRAYAVEKKLQKIGAIFRKMKKISLYNEVIYTVFAGTFGARRAVMEQRSTKGEKDVASDLKILLANATDLAGYLTAFCELMEEYLGKRHINVIIE